MKLKIALQKSGRLAEGSTDLLRKCGIGFSNGLGKLRAEAADFPLEIYFLRDDDIPDYVADGVADVGIVGDDRVIQFVHAALLDVAGVDVIAECDSMAQKGYNYSKDYKPRRVPPLLGSWTQAYGASRRLYVEVASS